MDCRAGIIRCLTGNDLARSPTTDFSSRSKRATHGSPKTEYANYWKEPAANTSPLCTRTEYVARLSGNFCFVRNRDPRGLWVSWAEEHCAADRDFPRYGSPDESSCTSTPRSFCRRARTTSASRGHGADWL